MLVRLLRFPMLQTEVLLLRTRSYGFLSFEPHSIAYSSDQKLGYIFRDLYRYLFNTS
jgi:hypothetical protein